MDKKKFYIILLSLVVVFLIGYLIMYLSSSLVKYKINPNKEKINPTKEEVKVIVPKVAFASGEVISNNDGNIKVKLEFDNKEIVIEVNSSDNDVELISGSYDENGGLENRKVSKISISKIEEGDIISFYFQDPVAFDQLEGKIFKVDDISINLPGNPELQ